MQKGGDGALLVEAVLAGEGERVDAAKVAILTLGNKPLNGVDGVCIGTGSTAAEARTDLELRSWCRLRKSLFHFRSSLAPVSTVSRAFYVQFVRWTM